ncbi:hypothetical protein [Ramlibacter alkalitolerans]|jgi:hypothetical protein|uniref:PH domain-containing protein n=1 Tax=Ramlibacter alkalitolerans TaxID=2039631 RepID=A0ABS1JQY7_9BURK|nr:hypothetical protein [Ramlibacter alkalitolerans]MBL0426653.1 hypothetical protein [Ramlibacter alkalitolerans]
MLAALVASGLLLVQAGALPFWVWAVVAALAIGTRLLAHVDRYRDELFLSEEGVSRQHGSRLRKTSTESVRWDELVKVEVLTNETGAGRKDLLLLLYGTQGSGVAVPGSVAKSHALVPALERRLPGFRTDAFAQAERSTERRSWTLWERAGAPPP